MDGRALASRVIDSASTATLHDRVLRLLSRSQTLRI